MTYATELYTGLCKLVASNNAFYYKEFNVDSRVYRIFNYRMASYTDFTQEYALECRGIMFDITDYKTTGPTGGPDRDAGTVVLKCLPMEKFFNLYENPFTTGLDLTKVTKIYEKADGSLISTYIHNNDLRLKSKASTISVQCIDAMKWLDENSVLKNDIYNIAKSGKTVNMEWCSLDNRVVIAYEEPVLKILNIRDHETGLYVDEYTEKMKCYRVASIDPGTGPEAFINSIPDMKDDIEGFVIYLSPKGPVPGSIAPGGPVPGSIAPGGPVPGQDPLRGPTGIEQKVKVKTKAYLARHTAISNVRNPRTLYNLILEEVIDDTRAKFHDDPSIIRQIDEMQIKVDKLFNECATVVEKFHHDNSKLSRKDYAVKAKKDLSDQNFPLAMKRYTNESVDYKEYFKCKWREFGILDEPTRSGSPTALLEAK
jgi:hypothetical protein